jgi:hypothetical protein
MAMNVNDSAVRLHAFSRLQCPELFLQYPGFDVSGVPFLCLLGCLRAIV